MKTTLTVAMLLVTISGCSSAPRFSHIDMDGPAPFVMFDQVTGRLCWAGQDTANGEEITVSNSKGQETKMAVCADLVKGLVK